MRKTTFACAALLAFCGGAASADEITLIFATTNPPTDPTNLIVSKPWAARIDEAGKGLVKIDVLDGPAIANHGNAYPRVVNDVVQIARGAQSIVAGKFLLSEVMTQPFVTEDSERASVAFWRLYKTGLLDSE